MPRTTLRKQLVGLLALTGLLVISAPAHADESQDLARAIKLFDQGDYITAQEILAGIDREKLPRSERPVRDDYLDRVTVAVTMSEKAARDLEDAETAMTEARDNPEIAGEETDLAKRLLRNVAENRYAHATIRRAALGYLRDLGEAVEVPAAPQVPAPVAAPEVAPRRAEQEVTPPPAQEQITAPPVQRQTDPARQRTRADVDRAGALIREGKEMIDASRYDEAGRKFQEALGASPGHPDAVAGLQEVRQHQQNVVGAGVDLARQIRIQHAINWQRAEVQYRDLERKIRQGIAGNRFAQARQLQISALQVVESARQYADPVSKYESLRSELNALTNEIEDREQDYHANEAQKVRIEIEEFRRRTMEDVENRREERVKELMSQAQRLHKDGNLDKAIDMLNQVTIIDPTYDAARWLMDELADRRSYRLQADIKRRNQEETRRLLIGIEEAKIPWPDTLRYAKNWPEIISRPERARVGESGQTSVIISALDRPVLPNFNGDPFDQVINALARANGVNMVPNWNDLKASGVDRNVPIELSLPNEITLRKALTEVLEQAGAGKVRLGFDVADGVLTIATQQHLDERTHQRVFNISDLVMPIPNFVAPEMDLTRIGRLAFRSPDMPFRWGDDDDDEPEEDPERLTRVHQLIDIIQDTIAPDSWRDRGGSIGTIKQINNQLVVTQNTAAQSQVADLLNKLREQRAIQINVEARFLTVSSHYIEELGIDIDIVLNAGNAGFDFTGFVDPILGNQLLLPRAFSRLGFIPSVPGVGTSLTLGGIGGQTPPGQPFNEAVLVPPNRGGGGSRITPIPIQNNISDIASAANLSSDIPGTFAGGATPPALNIFGSFLDNIQVDFLVRATQADSRNSVLTAPHLILFSGQRSFVAVTVQTSFVSQLDPTVNVGAAAQAPLTGVINAGIVLDVQATVSNDKRYVTMNIRPSVTRLNSLSTFQFGAGGTAGQGFIQIPELATQIVRTTVQVPDGGTLLVGGQKLASETEIEAGVPILSKIPIFKRMYSSRSMVKDEQTLLILIKPTILIQSELEEKAFPSFRGG